MKNAIRQTSDDRPDSEGVAGELVHLKTEVCGAEHPVKVEVDYFDADQGRTAEALSTPFWRITSPEVNHLKLVIRVKDGEQTLAGWLWAGLLDVSARS